MFDIIVNGVLNNFLGFILGIIATALLFVWKEKRKIPRLQYEKISTLSLISMDKKIKDRIKITCDGEPTNNIFSFKFKIRNVGKVSVKNIPIVAEFDDKNTQILDIKESFTSKDREKNLKLVLKHNRGEIFIHPGLEKGEAVTFDVFTLGNKDADLASFKIKLGKEALGVQWKHFTSKKIDIIGVTGVIIANVGIMLAISIPVTRLLGATKGLVVAISILGIGLVVLFGALSKT